MSLKNKVIQLLADGQFHSGESIGARFSLSRAAIWKIIKGLREIGLEIHAVSGRGYRLANPLQLLSQKALLQAYEDAGGRQPLTIELFTELDSTNRYLMSKASTHRAQAPIVCIAEYQSQGRGRRGKTWHTPFGHNISFSILQYLDCSPMLLSGLSLAIGVSVARVLENWLPPHQRLAVKWPNDIYVNDKKLGGILIEYVGDAVSGCQVVIGIGLNGFLPEHVQAAIERPVIDLHRICAGEVSRNDLIGALIAQISCDLPQYIDKGLVAFKQDYARFDWLAGKHVTLQQGREQIAGYYHGISDLGLLQLRETDGIHTYSCGEVSVNLSPLT